jgi:hypothetical protein
VYLGDQEVAVVDGGAVQLDEHIVVADLGDGGVLEHKTVKALAGARDEPLLLGGGE